MKSRPIIGIIAAKHFSGGILAAYGTNCHYLEQIEAAGGIPMQIPLIAGISEEALSTYVKVCDGFLLPGGPDFDSTWYGEELLDNLMHHSYELDLATQKTALELVRKMVASKKPVLGICLGVQVLNVAMGGSLYQDIPTQIETELTHAIQAEVIEDRWKIAHMVKLSEGSLIRQISGANVIEVNSFHHQAIKKLAPGFTATAWAPDGIVETIEHDSGRVLGVQWHPENLAHSGREEAKNLFTWLVNMATK